MDESMNDSLQVELDSLCLVEIIELKWLLIGHGVAVHVEQLQTDPKYARAVLDRAAEIPNRALQEAAARVRACLDLDQGSASGEQPVRKAAAA
jgi:hypothetical protein